MVAPKPPSISSENRFYSAVASGAAAVRLVREIAPPLPPVRDIRVLHAILQTARAANDNMPIPWWVLASGFVIESARQAFQVASSVGAAAASPEIGAALVFAGPIAIIGIEYLRHPEKFQNRPRPTCGEKPPTTILPWLPMRRPMGDVSFGRPSLTDTDRFILATLVQSWDTDLESLKRQLQQMEIQRYRLRWYHEGDLTLASGLDDAIANLRQRIFQRQRDLEISELENKLKGLAVGSTEALKIRQQISELRTSFPVTGSQYGMRASASEASSAVPATSLDERLPERNWDPSNRERILALIRSQGIGSPRYDPNRRPYVVFDWDNTAIFLDIEEAVLVFQLLNLEFGATPEQLETALRMGVPEDDFGSKYRNAAGQAVNIKTIVPDIIASYKWLYKNYKGFDDGGTMELDDIQKTPHYLNFTAKVRFLYDAIGDRFDHAVSYPWITYLFAGMTESRVRALTVATVKWQKTQPIEKVTWTSPESLSGQSGVVTVSWRNGLRTVPEMQDLFHAFRDAGFDVWVCSASFVGVIREFSSNPLFGYNNPPENVLAMELEKDSNGYLPEFRRGYVQTQGPGKTVAIKERLVGLYGYGPVFIAGDSEGDQNMMRDFDPPVVLIVNRRRDPNTDIGRFSAKAMQQRGQPDAQFLLQGRDENAGHWLRQPDSVLLGQGPN